ncbi:MAG TPA: immunoglobulin domain-containing protein [Verrucomicrobiae bacterium]
MKKPLQTKQPSHTAGPRFLRPLFLFLLCLGLSGVPNLHAQSYVLTNLWSIAPDAAHPFMRSDNNTRGLAYNPTTGHLLVPSRTVSPAIHILSGTDGQTLGKLPYDGSVVTGGNFAVNMIGITEDGVIYVGNLTTDAIGANGPFRLYRWADETAQPVLVYAGDPSESDAVANNRRFGDSLVVRGTGVNTEILLGTLDKNVALLTTTDGTTFTAKKIVTDGAAADTRWGLAWGAGETFWAKQSSGNLKKFTLNRAAGTATLTTTVTGIAGAPLALELSRNLLAIVEAGTTATAGHLLRMFDISDPAAVVQQDTTRVFPANPTNANGNATGAVALRNGKLFALESNNGILAYSVHEVYLPPTITTSPASVTVWEGAENYTFTVVHTGTKPFTYQWRLDGQDIPGAINATLVLPKVSYAQRGLYSVVVSNQGGSATSGSATLTVTPGYASDQMTNIWNIAPNTRPYLTSGYKEYGVAINPLTTNVLVLTRQNPTNMLVVLDPFTGAEKHYIDYSALLPFSSGYNKVGVAQDGRVYLCNLSTDTASNPFRIDGLSDDGPVPAVAGRELFKGDPGNGHTSPNVVWGGTLAVRGGGAETQILLGSGSWNQSSKTVAILRTDESGIFTSTAITVPDAPDKFGRLGLDWGPGTNTFWAKSTVNLVLIEFDLEAGTGFVRNQYPLTGARSVPSSVTGIGYDPVSGLLAGLQNGSPPTPVSVPVYDVTDPDAGPLLVDQELFQSYNADIEFQGNVDFGAGYLVALGVNNGLKMFRVNSGAITRLPIITSHPTSGTWYQGTSPTLTVVAESTSPLTYQWYFGSKAIADATDASLVIPNIQVDQAGDYFVRVSNTDGYRDSAPATLAVVASYTTAQMTNLWAVTAGSRPYLNTTYNEYGMAFNPANSNLLVVSLLNGNLTVAVLDALTGEDKHVLDVSTVTSATKLLHKIDVADDGVVYAGNLTTAAASNPFKLYRWANDAPDTVATVAFEGDPTPVGWPNKGCGYTLDVRGAGVNTEVLLGMGAWNATSNFVAILKTTDGTNFTATEIHVPAAPSGFSRLGLCFGAANTFWAKTWLGQLYLVEYDLAAGTGTILKTYDSSLFSNAITSLDYNHNLKFLAGAANDTQKNIQLYSVADLEAGPQLRDQELFPTYNASIEANGELDFGGNTYLFALNENNGIMAFVINAGYAPPVTSFKILSVTPASGSVTLTWEAVSGAKYQVQRASTLDGAWTSLGNEVTASGDTASYVDSNPDPAMRFYRVLAK